MIGRKQTRDIHSMHPVSRSAMVSVGPDELKILVRDLLASMTRAGCDAFVLALEAELRSVHLSMRSYLFLLGISVTSVDELTPGDIGHFVRFLKINVPNVMLAVDEVIERFSAFAAKGTEADDRLAA
jgi:hypothetical protein